MTLGDAVDGGELLERFISTSVCVNGRPRTKEECINHRIIESQKDSAWKMP